MKLINYWSIKAKDEIRGIDFGDVDGDGENEVIFASWEGKIYVVKARSGQVSLRFPKRGTIEGVAENVLILNGNRNQNLAVASFNRKVIGMDLEKGEQIWESPLDSWIVKMFKADIDEDGEEEIVGFTTSGSRFGLDWGGEKLWVVKGTKILTPNKMSVGDINFDGSTEIISPGSKPNILEIMGSDGGVLHKIKLHDDIESIAIGDINPNLEGVLIVGTKSSVYFWNEDFKKMYKIRGGHIPYHIGVADINSDGVNEVLICDWLKNRVNILSINEDLEVKKIGEINVEGNPIFAGVINLRNGDKLEDIMVATKSTEIGIEDKFQIGSGRKRIEMAWSASIHPPVVGDIFGMGSQELLLRTNREELSLIIGLPKIAAPQVVKAGSDFTVTTWTPADFTFESSRLLKTIEKVSSSRKRYPEVGFVTTNTYKLKASRAGKGRLKLSKRSGRESVVKSVFIFSDNRIISDSVPLIVSKEDKIKLDLDYKIKEVRSLTRKVEIRLLDEDDEQFVLFSTYLSGLINVPIELEVDGEKESRVRKTNLRIYVSNPLNAEAAVKEVMLEDEAIEVKLKNYSNLGLNASIEIEEPIDSPPINLKVPARRSKKVSIKINYSPKELMEEVNTVLLITYKGLRRHKLTIPFKTKVINKKRLKEIIKEIKSTIKTKKQLKESLKEVLKLEENYIDELLQKIKI